MKKLNILLSSLPKLDNYKEEFLSAVFPYRSNKEREDLWQSQFSYRNVAIYVFDKNPDKVLRSEIEYRNVNGINCIEMVYSIGIGYRAVFGKEDKPALFYLRKVPLDEEDREKSMKDNALKVEDILLRNLKGFKKL